jgi:hypothetical protein
VTEDDWLDPDTDEDNPDVCHHGIGFDVDCEWCAAETAEELRAARRQRDAEVQPQLPLEDTR